ncbi:MAG: hypothetical protein IPJ76_11915 [Flavobacteriales bacterium]|nr:MAG: hypothetical protein IPJ76_11915 [Flavobacteriales bacterium]
MKLTRWLWAVLVGIFSASVCLGQEVPAELAVVEFMDAQVGTIVGTDNGTLHIVRIITKAEDVDVPLLAETKVRTSNGEVISARLVRPINIDGNYILGLYRCSYYNAAAASHRLSTILPGEGTQLAVAMDERPPHEPVFEPKMNRVLTFAGRSLEYHEAKPDPATQGPSSAPVYDQYGTLIGITLEKWAPAEERLSIRIIPIVQVRELILGNNEGNNGTSGRPCIEFDLRDTQTLRNTCEEREHRARLVAEAEAAELARLEEAERRHAAQSRYMLRLERQMIQQTFTIAPFIGLGQNAEFHVRPTGGISFFLFPDGLFQPHLKLQGALQDSEKNYEDTIAVKFGYDRLRTNSQFGEVLLGFTMLKGDFFFGALGGVGMEGPVRINRSYGTTNYVTSSKENWTRPVTQFDIGVQIAAMRLLIGVRTVHGEVANAYKAENLGLSGATHRPAEDLPANGSMVVLEFAFRLSGWWNTDMKASARSEFELKGGVPKPR